MYTNHHTRDGSGRDSYMFSRKPAGASAAFSSDPLLSRASSVAVKPHQPYRARAADLVNGRAPAHRQRTSDGSGRDSYIVLGGSASYQSSGEVAAVTERACAPRPAPASCPRGRVRQPNTMSLCSVVCAGFGASLRSYEKSVSSLAATRGSPMAVSGALPTLSPSPRRSPSMRSLGRVDTFSPRWSHGGTSVAARERNTTAARKQADLSARLATPKFVRQPIKFGDTTVTGASPSASKTLAPLASTDKGTKKRLKSPTKPLGTPGGATRSPARKLRRARDGSAFKETADNQTARRLDDSLKAATSGTSGRSPRKQNGRAQAEMVTSAGPRTQPLLKPKPEDLPPAGSSSQVEVASTGLW